MTQAYTTTIEDTLARSIDSPDWRVFDCRYALMNRQDGHIPAWANKPFEGNLDADEKFLASEKLQARILQTVTNVAEKKIIHSCDSVVTTCHNILAMEISGLTGSLFYPGSWGDWIT